jgi:hypothetical protein
MKPGSRASPHFGQTRQRRGIPVQTPATPPLPVSVPKLHASNCLCAECHTAGQHRADYDKAKMLQELL